MITYTNRSSSTYEGRGVRLRVTRDEYGSISYAHLTAQGKTLSLSEGQVEELLQMFHHDRINNDGIVNEVI